MNVWDVEALSDFLHVSVKTCRRYTQRGLIPHKRLGSRVLYLDDAIREWLQNEGGYQTWQGTFGKSKARRRG